jgi:hypothetical protein
MKTKTIKVGGGADYAQVKDRLNEFRNDNPRGLVETAPTIQPDGQIMFKARILKDKADETSAEATGHALGANKGVKAFEKLETIAVGRALALLGYGSDGAIASSEEMEEFEDWRTEKKLEAIDKLTKAKNLAELKDVWNSIGNLTTDKEVEKIKNEIKTRLSNENN